MAGRRAGSSIGPRSLREMNLLKSVETTIANLLEGAFGRAFRSEGVEEEVIDELCAYLLEHARREDLVLASHPHISFHTDERLALGEFGIQALLVRPEGQSEEAQLPDEPEEHGKTMIY